MGRISRTFVAGCIVLLVAGAPFATAASAAAATADVNASSVGEAGLLGLSISDPVENVTNTTGEAARTTADATTDAMENATNGSSPTVETGVGDRSDPGGERPEDLDGDEVGGRSAETVRHGDGAALLAAPDLGSLVVLEPPGPTVAAPAIGVEVHTGSTVGDATLRVSLDGDGIVTRSPDDAVPGVAADAGTSPESVADDVAVERVEARTPTPSRGTGATGSADDGSGAEPSAAAGTGGFDPAAPLQAAPALGTALFAVAARPWLGVLSGAATTVSGWVGRAFVLFRYRSRDGSDPLEHETRGRIHDLVSGSPGRTLTDLSDELDTPLSTIRHHVKILERERVVVSRKLRGNRRLYPLGAENEELAAALREESSAAVIETLHEQGRATVGEVVDTVGKSYSTVSYHLSRLADEGLVVQERDGRETVSRLDPAVESLLDAPDEAHRADAAPAGREASAD